MNRVEGPPAARPDQSHGQVFVILRVTAPAGGGLPESAVGVVKAVWSATEAEAEAQRLNQTKRTDGSIYFWKAARLNRAAMPAGD
jgi:hypothetical protein